MKYTKKPVTIEATQWFRNGDHPGDYAEAVEGFEKGELVEFSPDHQKIQGWEGQVVRYYRHPKVPGARVCEQCSRPMADHGWIDTLEGGHIVCPGDWIITGVQGEKYPCKPDIFAATYAPHNERQRPMEIFLDCEWNSYGGALISMALVAMDGREMYVSLPLHEELDPWVAEHVVPVLGEPESLSSHVDLAARIGSFLSAYPAVHVIADWPEDIERFCRALVVGPGARVCTPPLTLEIRRDLDSEQSALPHNALADARAIKDHYLSLMGDA